MDGPAITLLLALLGLALGVVFVASLITGRASGRLRWAQAATIVAFVALVVALPGEARQTLTSLSDQHTAYEGTYEQKALERCLRDMGRADLPAALEFARAQIPEDARYFVRTRSQSVGCLMLNLFPREPVRELDYDPARDWIVLDAIGPGQLRRGPLRDGASDTGRHLPHGDSFVVVRPEGAP